MVDIGTRLADIKEMVDMGVAKESTIAESADDAKDLPCILDQFLMRSL